MILVGFRRYSGEQHKVEVIGQPVGHIEPERASPIDEALNAGSGDSGIPRQAFVACSALGYGASKGVRDRRGRLAGFHGVGIVAR